MVNARHAIIVILYLPVAYRMPDRVCGCGAGDSGCSECGVCRTCAGELLDADRTPEAAKPGLLEALARSKDMIPLDLLLGK